MAPLWLACGDDQPSEAAHQASLARADEARLQELRRIAGEAPASEAGVRAAFDGAELALRLGRDPEHVERAVALLRPVADDWKHESACRALERLARVHALAADPEAEAIARARGALRQCPGVWTRPGEGPSAEAARAAESTCHLRALEVTRSGEAARIVATLQPGPLRESCPVEEQRQGERLELRVEGLSTAPWAEGAAGLGPVEGVRVEAGALVVDFAAGADPRTFFLLSPLRAVVEVMPPPPAIPEGAPLVVLDPGHGGVETGAQFDGLDEAKVVLDLAQRVRRILARRAPTVRVELTRTEDTELALEARAARANELDADAFVSLHLNAADEPVRRGGITTFVLDTTDDRQALRLAARENGTHAGEVSQLQRLLAGLHREDQLAGSRALAESVHGATLIAGRHHLPALPDRGVRSALFYVLVGARMPAILLEASFLTKPVEAEALKTDGYRQTLAQGIAAGILRYLASRVENESAPATQ